MEKKIYDKELGTITLRFSQRATRYALKIRKGAITATMPVDGDEERMRAFISENREKLLQALEEHPPREPLNEETVLQTTTFRLHIFRTDRVNFYMNMVDDVLHLACPKDVDFEEEWVQGVLTDLLTKALRHEAYRLLPKRLMELAKRYGFTCTGVKVFNSKTRWGSCTQRKSINLSLSLMLLPWHLIDYVLLHELCHTREMNHSERFWELMNQVTNNKALELRAELKGYHIL